MNYFYIIQFDGAISEIPYNEDRHKAALEALAKGGVAILQDRNGEPMGFNAGTIAKVLTENQYETHIMSANIKRYIKSGSWYDSKHVFIKHEKWKQEKIDEKKRLSEPKEVELTPEQKAKNLKRLKEIRESLDKTTSK